MPYPAAAEAPSDPVSTPLTCPLMEMFMVVSSSNCTLPGPTPAAAWRSSSPRTPGRTYSPVLVRAEFRHPALPVPQTAGVRPGKGRGVVGGPDLAPVRASTATDNRTSQGRDVIGTFIMHPLSWNCLGRPERPCPGVPGPAALSILHAQRYSCPRPDLAGLVPRHAHQACRPSGRPGYRPIRGRSNPIAPAASRPDLAGSGTRNPVYVFGCPAPSRSRRCPTTCQARCPGLRRRARRSVARVRGVETPSW